MKIFDKVGKWKDKVNFIDKNNVVLGYDMGQCCCENAYWELQREGIVVDLTEGQLLPYAFDTSYFQELDDPNDKETLKAIFKLQAEGLPDVFVVLSNTHNGYYSHGFTFKKDEAVIQDGSL